MRSLLVPTLLAVAAAATTFTVAAIEPAAPLDAKVVAWRRDIHQHPELGHKETRTAALVAEHLDGLGLQVRTGIAGTGVSGLLRGGKPGRRIALRADMDALPVTEAVDLPFASKVTTTYRGQPVGVMHACGHDAHVAILMGVAEALAAQREALAGEVMFVFQPAEEGPPEVGQVFGAAKMLEDGVFADFTPEAVIALHMWSALPTGKLGTRSGPLMASADEWTLTVTGRQTHGSKPWAGVDPISVTAQILLGTHGIVARQVDVTASPVVLTAGVIRGGVRFNIIPDTVELTGTLRSFDMAVRDDVIARFRRTAQHFAEASDAKAELVVANNAPVTKNDAALFQQLRPALDEAAGAGNVVEMPLSTVAEDFSQFANRVPGFYFFVGSTPVGTDPAKAPANHSPHFLLDEASLAIGTRAMLAVAERALQAPQEAASSMPPASAR